MIEPIVKELRVSVTCDRAFDIFTRDIFKWWPAASHSLSASDGKLPRNIEVTPKVGGAIREELHDGSFADWGVITKWEQGRNLAFTWHLRRPKTEQTMVEVDFQQDGEGTHIRLTHSGWDAIGEQAEGGREQYLTGWDYVLLECYAQATD